MKNRLKQLFVEKTEDTRIQLFRSTQSSQYSYLFDLGIYLLLVEILSVPYLAARLVSYLAGTTMSYFLSILWIFPSRKVDNRWLEYGSFITIGLAGAVGNLGLMAILKEILGFHHIPANIAAGITVFFFSFTLRKIFLFSRREND